jgi:FCP1-like phosphatase family protein
MNLDTSACDHSVTFGNLCAICGAYVRPTNAAVTHGGLRLSESAAEAESAELAAYLSSSKKLALILDLDKTLIDPIRVPDSAAARALVALDPDHAADFLTFSLDTEMFIVRYRPCLGTFLETLAPHFHFYVSTLASRKYAERVVQYIDPAGEYFGSRLLCGDDSAAIVGQRKSLTAFFQDDGAMALIVDDSPQVWRQSRGVVQIEPFDFFNCWAVPPTVWDSGKDDRALPLIAEVLLAVHADYFSHERGYHVLLSLSALRERVLRGCHLLFLDLQDARIRDDCFRRAEQFGASALVQFMPHCTHVVAMSLRGPDAQEALEFDGIFLVSYRWFHESCLRFARADEAEERFRIEDGAPAVTAGPRQRTDPPPEVDADTSELSMGLESDGEEDGDEEESSSVDLAFLDE